MPTPIELDALASALERGESIDTDRLRRATAQLLCVHLLGDDGEPRAREHFNRNGACCALSYFPILPRKVGG